MGLTKLQEEQIREMTRSTYTPNQTNILIDELNASNLSTAQIQYLINDFRINPKSNTIKNIKQFRKNILKLLAGGLSVAVVELLEKGIGHNRIGGKTKKRKRAKSRKSRKIG